MVPVSFLWTLAFSEIKNAQRPVRGICIHSKGDTTQEGGMTRTENSVGKAEEHMGAEH